MRQPGLGVERGREIPLRHPDVVLLGREADLLVGLERLRPRARHLPGDPGVRRLADAQDAVAVGPHQHARESTLRPWPRRLASAFPP